MISVGSRDARKSIGLGGGRRKMEDTELEEGEACSYQNNEDYDSNMDPDVVFSYIDEKLQHVLGHFQKDFEGGFTAENLGPKFGGYGSFLPSHQRSPVWSRSKTPPKGPNLSTSRSPNNFQQEGGHNNSVVSSTTPQSTRPGPPSTSSTSLPLVKAPILNESSKQEVCMPFQHAHELASGYGRLKNKSATSSDQKSLKVRIKVGSNLSARKNDEIYSGLGLDVSASSSLDDSPSESEGLSRELHDGPFESPTSILQMMTSFPVHGGLLLSPLPDDLTHLTLRGKPARDKKSFHFQQYSQESSCPLANGSSLKGSETLAEKKMKLKDKNDFVTESTNTNRKDFLNSQIASKRDAEIDSVACEELVSNALKLPLLANSIDGDFTKSMCKPTEKLREGNSVIARDRLIFNQPEENLVEILGREDEKKTKGSSGKAREIKKINSFDDISVFSKKFVESKKEKTVDLVEVASKGNTISNSEQIDYLKQKTNHITTAQGHNDVKYASGKEHSISEGKKKSKFSLDCVPNGEKSKLSMKSGSSSSKTKGVIKVGNTSTRSEFEDQNSQKDFRKTNERYKEFFGESEEEDNHVDASEVPSVDQLNHSDVFEKRTFCVHPTSKERLSVTKFDRPLANPAGGTVSDATPAAMDTVSAQDNWVCCDKCQKWRLLPLGTNPADLPEKWLCSMLNWLPGMNQCNFSEEETTKALIARYQVPVPGGVMLGVANAQQSEPNRHNYDLHDVPGGGKKKHRAKERSSMTPKGDVPQLSNFKKNEGSMKSRSLDDVNQLPIGDEADFDHLNKSSDVSIEKHRHKHKESRESDKGGTKSLKMKNKREKEQDYFRPSKKVKTDCLDLIDEDQISVHSGSVVRVGPTLSTGFPSVSGEDKYKNNDYTLKGSKYAVHQISNDKRENKLLDTLDDGFLERGNGSIKSNPKKRKVKASPGSQTNLGFPNGSGNLHQKSSPAMGLSDSDYRKEKKAKLSKPPGKESSGRKEKKGSHSKDWPLGQDVGSTLSQRSLDGVDSLKRELGVIQPSHVATSSSSKISGSHKTKSSFQEMKGSPVESVSSSPMRISNRDKILQSSKDNKDAFRDAGHTRCSDGDDDGASDRSGTGSKKKSVVPHHRHLKSPMIFSLNKDVGLPGKKDDTRVKSSDFPSCDLNNGSLEHAGIDNQHPSKPWVLEQGQAENKPNEMNSRGNVTVPVKCGKDSPLQLKDKHGSYCSEIGMDKDKVPYLHDELRERSPRSDMKVKNGKQKLQENSRIKTGDVDNKYINRKDVSGRFSSDRAKRESQLNSVKFEGPDSTVNNTSKDNMTLSARKNQPQDCNGTASKRPLSQKSDQLEKIPSKSMPVRLPTSGEFRKEALHCPPVGGFGKGNTSEDALEGNDVLKGKKHIKKVDRQKETQHNGSRHSTPNERLPNDAPSPARRDSSNQAATKAMKEAKDLKHLADRFKNSGSNLESIGLYFQAALKFLYGASLFESSNSENAKHSEVIQSMQIYSSTAKLCEFCAHEYEKIKDMAAAALAYKCMEVAYMRVIYSSHSSAIRDGKELQRALQMVPSGESPSSSASDVDNLNNPTAADKAVFPKGVVSTSQVTGSHVIAAGNRPTFLRLLSYAQDVNFAMEASRKSQIAFAAAGMSTGGTTNKEGISCIKTALDFSFQDVEGLLSLVRIAMEAINR